MNVVDRMNMFFCFFFSFGGYEFFGFETHTNHMICTKVRNISQAFGINFSTCKPAPLEH
jgi:hypothetical protein